MDLLNITNRAQIFIFQLQFSKFDDLLWGWKLEKKAESQGNISKTIDQKTTGTRGLNIMIIQCLRLSISIHT